MADVIEEGKHVTYDLKADRNDPTAVGTREMAAGDLREAEVASSCHFANFIRLLGCSVYFATYEEKLFSHRWGPHNGGLIRDAATGQSRRFAPCPL